VFSNKNSAGWELLLCDEEASLWLLWACAVQEQDGEEPITEATADWEEAWTELEDEVLDLVNQRRFLGATCGGEARPGGLEPLEADDLLRAVARLHSQDMAERDFFDHVNPDGDDPFARMESAGFAGAQPWGENIAAGAPTAEVVVQGWMDSPGHCENIMLPQFRVLGIGYFMAEGVGWEHYWTQNFAGGH
jgi:uncharacterized protein YkwD